MWWYIQSKFLQKWKSEFLQFWNWKSKNKYKTQGNLTMFSIWTPLHQLKNSLRECSSKESPKTLPSTKAMFPKKPSSTITQGNAPNSHWQTITNTISQKTQHQFLNNPNPNPWHSHEIQKIVLSYQLIHIFPYTFIMQVLQQARTLLHNKKFRRNLKKQRLSYLSITSSDINQRIDFGDVT